MVVGTNIYIPTHKHEDTMNGDRLSTETVEGAARALEGVHDVESSDGLAVNGEDT